MTISEKIKFHLMPGHGVVVECYDEEMADSLDDFFTEQRGEEFSLKFSEGKVIFFLSQQISEEVVRSMLQEFSQNYEG